MMILIIVIAVFLIVGNYIVWVYLPNRLNKDKEAFAQEMYDYDMMNKIMNDNMQKD